MSATILMSEGRSSVFHGLAPEPWYSASQDTGYDRYNWKSSLCLVSNLPSLVPLSKHVKWSPVWSCLWLGPSSTEPQPKQSSRYVSIANGRRVKQPEIYQPGCFFYLHMCLSVRKLFLHTLKPLPNSPAKGQQIARKVNAGDICLQKN